MQIQLTKYVNKMQTSVQCEKITFESPTPNNHMFKSYIYVSRMLSNNKLYAHKTPFSNKQTIQKLCCLSDWSVLNFPLKMEMQSNKVKSCLL